MKNISGIVAGDIMHSPVICAHPDDTLKKLEGALEDRKISGMPVVKSGVMVGIITQDDLVQVPVLLDAMARYVSSELLSDGPVIGGEDTDGDGVPDDLTFRSRIPNMKVSEVMARSVVSCEPTTALDDVISLMVKHHIHRIIITQNDTPVGIVSTLDVLQAIRN